MTEMGSTAALSVDLPTKEDIAFSEVFSRLMDLTKESKDESQLREKTLAWLDEICKKWIASMAIKQGIREESAKTLGGRIYTFGSYRLGVHGPGADIDTLLVTPKHVTREDYFSSFPMELKKYPIVTEVVPVPDAAVPLIKMKIDSLNIDLLFASLNLTCIPNDFKITQDEILKEVDEQTQRSLNGTRVASKMLECVPKVHTFRTVLRGVKKWAQSRGVYGNVYGYPGGVAWAILTARVCQLYPNAAPGPLFAKFFQFHSVWWKDNPEYPLNPNSPIYLTKTLDVDYGYGFKVWNRK
eukprot:Sspe_Gene.88927::Locus_60832_Transcript_1_1_Confidence_1.000_Length_941::g.88927::m.88927/K14376/PAP; poly(A) polymerase